MRVHLADGEIMRPFQNTIFKLKVSDVYRIVAMFALCVHVYMWN